MKMSKRRMAASPVPMTISVHVLGPSLFSWSRDRALFLFRRESVNTAFEFLTAPAAGARVIWIIRYCRAWLAADAQIASIVLRKVRDSIRPHVTPHLVPRPIRQQAHFPQGLSRRQTMLFYFFQIPARG